MDRNYSPTRCTKSNPNDEPVNVIQALQYIAAINISNRSRRQEVRP